MLLWQQRGSSIGKEGSDSDPDEGEARKNSASPDREISPVDNEEVEEQGQEKTLKLKSQHISKKKKMVSFSPHLPSVSNLKLCCISCVHLYSPSKAFGD